MARTGTILALTLLLLGVGFATAAEPKRVLMLQSFGPRFAPFNAFTPPFRRDLIRRTPGAVAISEVSLEAARVAKPAAGTATPDAAADRATLDYLRALFPAPPDLMIAVGGPAAMFLRAHRPELFPTAPLLITATEARQVDAAAMTERDLAVPHVIDLPAILGTILEVQPKTRKVIVVLGASPLERLWRGYAEQAFAPFAGRISFEWTNDLDFKTILDRAAAATADTAILYGLMMVDATGAPFEEDEAIAALASASAAPVFGVFDSQLGQGILGGRMVPIAEMAERSAEVAARLLAGEPASAVPAPPVMLGPPTFDSRRLARLGIDEDALPAGSLVRFREPSVWDRYGGPILAALALCLAQAAFIAGLLVSRRRLRRSEAALTESEARLREAAAEARDFAGRLIRAQEDERSRLGRELHDDVTQRLAVMAIDVGRCEQRAGDPARAEELAGVREGLARLSGDVHALAYQLHPSILADLGLVAALGIEADRVTRVEGLPVELTTTGAPDSVPRAVALCLYRVAQEALRNIARHAAATRARVSLRAEGGGVTLTIEDDGRGFDPEAARRRPSLGLASMRQRVAAVGGSARIESGPGRGTRIRVEIPPREAKA